MFRHNLILNRARDMVRKHQKIHLFRWPDAKGDTWHWEFYGTGEFHGTIYARKAYGFVRDLNQKSELA